MSNIFRWLLAITFIIFLFDHGGEGDFVSISESCIISIILFFLAFTLRDNHTKVDYSWAYFLFLPLIFISFLFIAKLGFNHPWVTDDLLILGNNNFNNMWSIDPGSTLEYLNWSITLFGICLCLLTLFRGDRVRALIFGVVAIGCLHALIGIITYLCAFDWPSHIEEPVARGSFVYSNHAAAFWAACLPLAIQTAKHYKSKWLYISVGILALAIILSNSRGGVIVACIFSAPLIPNLLPSKHRLLWTIALVAGIAVWLSVIGINSLSEKFASLNADNKLSPNGRITIWKAAIPLIESSGPIGCGPGTTTMAYRRSGDPTFGSLVVDHLHNDYLEGLLEFGWVPLFTIIIFCVVAAAILIRKFLVKAKSFERKYIPIGAALGVLSLIFHSSIDFISHSPAISILAITLLVIISQSGNKINISNGNKFKLYEMRIVTIFTSIASMTAIIPAFKHYRDDIIARDAGRYIFQRISNGLPLGNSEIINKALVDNPSSVSLATMQSWMYRNIPELSNKNGEYLKLSQISLDRACQLCPGDARAWSERAAVNCKLNNFPEAAKAITRATSWAPSWPDLDISLLELYRNNSILGDYVNYNPIIDGLLNSNVDQPNWVFDIGENILGERNLSYRVLNSGFHIKYSAMSWLNKSGSLKDWMQIKRSLAELPIPINPECFIFTENLWNHLPYRVILPSTCTDRRQLAELILGCNLAMPDELSRALQMDGNPWSYWSKPFDLFDIESRRRLKEILKDELYHDWAVEWRERISTIEKLLSGDWSLINPDCRPEILFKISENNIININVPAGIVSRSKLLLNRYKIAEWTQINNHFKYSYIYMSKEQCDAVVISREWLGLVLDGKWIGWIRGTTNLSPLIGYGLHKIILLKP